jgi:hypothetical protein
MPPSSNPSLIQPQHWWVPILCDLQTSHARPVEVQEGDRQVLVQQVAADLRKQHPRNLEEVPHTLGALLMDRYPALAVCWWRMDWR